MSDFDKLLNDGFQAKMEPKLKKISEIQQQVASNSPTAEEERVISAQIGLANNRKTEAIAKQNRILEEQIDAEINTLSESIRTRKDAASRLNRDCQIQCEIQGLAQKVFSEQYPRFAKPAGGRRVARDCLETTRSDPASGVPPGVTTDLWPQLFSDVSCIALWISSEKILTRLYSVLHWFHKRLEVNIKNPGKTMFSNCYSIFIWFIR